MNFDCIEGLSDEDIAELYSYTITNGNTKLSGDICCCLRGYNSVMKSECHWYHWNSACNEVRYSFGNCSGTWSKRYFSSASGSNCATVSGCGYDYNLYT